MKSLTLLTKTKITSDKINQKLVESYRWKSRIVRNDESELFLGYFPHEFYIIYDDATDVKNPLCFFDEDDLKIIPSECVCVNELYYRDEVVAKWFVGKVLEEYPELYISDTNDIILSASDFINRSNK